MPPGPVKQIRAPGWLAISGACCPVAGVLLKLGHGGTLAAFALGVAPYALCALVYCLFGVGYLFAALRYLWTGKSQQEFLSHWSCAVVTILTLTPQAPEQLPGAATVPQPRDGSRRPTAKSRGHGTL